MWLTNDVRMIRICKLIIEVWLEYKIHFGIGEIENVLVF